MDAEDAEKLLKILTMIGGLYEILFGFLMIFVILPLFNLIGANITQIEYPIFHQTSGLLAIIIGLLMVFSSLNVRKYLINIILIIGLRFAIQLIIVINMLYSPEIAVGLLLFGIVDLIFAVITIYLIKAANLPFNVLKLIQ